MSQTKRKRLDHLYVVSANENKMCGSMWSCRAPSHNLQRDDSILKQRSVFLRNFVLRDESYDCRSCLQEHEPSLVVRRWNLDSFGRTISRKG